MPIFKKIKVGKEATEIDIIARAIKRELALRSLHYINPMVARGIIADEISHRINRMLRSISITKRKWRNWVRRNSVDRT